MWNLKRLHSVDFGKLFIFDIYITFPTRWWSFCFCCNLWWVFSYFDWTIYLLCPIYRYLKLLCRQVVNKYTFVYLASQYHNTLGHCKGYVYICPNVTTKCRFEYLLLPRVYTRLCWVALPICFGSYTLPVSLWQLLVFGRLFSRSSWFSENSFNFVSWVVVDGRAGG